MKTVFEHLRDHILSKRISEPIKVENLDELRRSEWSLTFETLMRNRLIMGAFRYGTLHSNKKPKYDRLESIIKRVTIYKETGNLELLVDIANMCLLEFEEGHHPNKHFHSIDDGQHAELTKKEN